MEILGRASWHFCSFLVIVWLCLGGGASDVVEEHLPRPKNGDEVGSKDGHGSRLTIPAQRHEVEMNTSNEIIENKPSGQRRGGGIGGGGGGGGSGGGGGGGGGGSGSGFGWGWGSGGGGGGGGGGNGGGGGGGGGGRGGGGGGGGGGGNDHGWGKGGGSGGGGGGGGGGRGGGGGGGGGGGNDHGWGKGGGGGGGGGRGRGSGWGCGGRRNANGGKEKGTGVMKKGTFGSYGTTKVREFAHCMGMGPCKGMKLVCPLHCQGPCVYDCEKVCRAHCNLC